MPVAHKKPTWIVHFTERCADGKRRRRIGRTTAISRRRAKAHFHCPAVERRFWRASQTVRTDWDAPLRRVPTLREMRA